MKREKGNVKVIVAAAGAILAGAVYAGTVVSNFDYEGYGYVTATLPTPIAVVPIDQSADDIEDEPTLGSITITESFRGNPGVLNDMDADKDDQNELCKEAGLVTGSDRCASLVITDAGSSADFTNGDGTFAIEDAFGNVQLEDVIAADDFEDPNDTVLTESGMVCIPCKIRRVKRKILRRVCQYSHKGSDGVKGGEGIGGFWNCSGGAKNPNSRRNKDGCDLENGDAGSLCDTLATKWMGCNTTDSCSVTPAEVPAEVGLTLSSTDLNGSSCGDGSTTCSATVSGTSDVVKFDEVMETTYQGSAADYCDDVSSATNCAVFKVAEDYVVVEDGEIMSVVSAPSTQKAVFAGVCDYAPVTEAEGTSSDWNCTATAIGSICAVADANNDNVADSDDCSQEMATASGCFVDSNGPFPPPAPCAVARK